MLSVNNVSMRYGARVLFEDVTCTFMAGRRYAISGPNGAGKSTLMKILTGEIEPTNGNVSRPKRMGVLRQDQFAFDDFRVIDTVIMGNSVLWATLQERDALYAKPHEELTDADGMRLGELEGIVGEEGGYTAEADAAILLDGLDIPSELHERKMRELQGGQKVRVLLAQALFGNPTALLLDEPTNYLDLDSVHWLQDYLTSYEGILIVISHDRHFLNEVSTTNPSSPTLAATTTWSSPKRPSARASNPKTRCAKRKSPSCRISSRAFPPAPVLPRPPRAKKKSNACKLPNSPDPTFNARSSNSS